MVRVLDPVGIEGRAHVIQHTLTPCGQKRILDAFGGPGYGSDDIDRILVPRGEAVVKKVLHYHNIALNQGLEHIVDALVETYGGAAPTDRGGMVLGTLNTAEAGTQTGILTLVTGSFKAFAATYPKEGGAINEFDWRTFWDTGEGTDSAIEEAAIVTDESTATTSGVSRINNLSVNKGTNDTLQITITWRLGTLAV